MNAGDRPAYAASTRDGETEPDRRVPVAALRQVCETVLAGAGLPDDAAALVADSLVDAEARGITSHGVVRTRIYSDRLRGGMLDGRARPEIRGDGPTVRVDAHNAIGHLGADAGARAAADAARAHGVGVAGVVNSNHCGTLAFFVRRLTAQRLVAIAASNSPPTMTYFGGRSRAVGTNPFAFGAPRPDGPDVVLDMATSATARGKIIFAARTGKPIPDGWAVDAKGRPTTDPMTALEGSVLPFAGPKGSGMAMMVELLCGALLGGPMGPGIGDMYEDWTRTQRVGHLFIALDPGSWTVVDEFAERIAEFAAYVHDLPAAEGSEGVLLPGEPEARRAEAAERQGIVLNAEVHDDLCTLLTEVGASPRQLTDVTTTA